MSIQIVIYCSRDVMLETPAMAPIIWSFYYFLSYLKHGRTKDMIFFFIFATLCPYTIVYPDYQSKRLYLYRSMGETFLPGKIPDIHLPVSRIIISGGLYE